MESSRLANQSATVQCSQLSSWNARNQPSTPSSARNPPRWHGLGGKRETTIVPPDFRSATGFRWAVPECRVPVRHQTPNRVHSTDYLVHGRSEGLPVGKLRCRTQNLEAGLMDFIEYNVNMNTLKPREPRPPLWTRQFLKPVSLSMSHLLTLSCSRLVYIRPSWQCRRDLLEQRFHVMPRLC
jgi:hypothetical protein